MIGLLLLCFCVVVAAVMMVDPRQTAGWRVGAAVTLAVLFLIGTAWAWAITAP